MAPDHTDRSLRVLLVAHGLPPESVGGVEQHVDGLARALTAAGHRVHVWAKTGRAGPEPGSTIDEPARPAVPYRVTRVVYRYEGLDGLLSLYRVPLLDRAFDSFLAAHEFDVVHVHHLTGLSTGILQVLHDRGLPTVLTLHDYWTICPRGQMWHRDGSVGSAAEPARCADCLHPGFGAWVPQGAAGEAKIDELLAHAREILALPQALVVPSARARPPFVALGIAEQRLRVVENGVDVTALGQLPIADPPPADRPLRVGYLGTLIPSKGLHVLVQAALRLPPRKVVVHAHGNVVPYHGDETWLTRTLAPLDPDHGFHWHGPYRTRALPRLFGGIDVLAAPALWHEAFGLTVREALAAGRPVLVSRIGGLQDAIVDGVGGRVLPPGDVAAWAAVLGELADDRDLVRRMARQARDDTPVRGFDAMATELLTLYRDLAC